jgi:hypothetical protein
MDVRNTDSNSSSPRPVKTTNEARQGITGQNVRSVLIISTVSVIAAFVVIWLYYFGH